MPYNTNIETVENIFNSLRGHRLVTTARAGRSNLGGHKKDFILLPFYSHNQRRFRCNNFKVLAIVRRLSNTQRISSSRFRLAQLNHALTSHVASSLGRAEYIFQFLCLLVYSCNQHWQQCINFKVIAIATRLCNTWQIYPSLFWLAQFNLQLRQHPFQWKVCE